MNIPRIEGESDHAHAAFKVWCQDEDRGTPTGLAAGYARRFNWAERLRSALAAETDEADAELDADTAIEQLTKREVIKLLKRTEADYSILTPAQLAKFIDYLNRAEAKPPTLAEPRDLSALTDAEFEIVRRASEIMQDCAQRVNSAAHVPRLSESQIEALLRNADLSGTNYLAEKNRLRNLSAQPWSKNATH